MTQTRALLEQAIELFGAQWRLAEAAGVTQAAISLALKADRVGVTLAQGIHKATEGKISRAELRPDIWGDETPKKKRAAR